MLQIGFITWFLTIPYTVYLLAFIAITTLILATIFLRIFSLIGEYIFVFFLEYLSLSFDNRLSPPERPCRSRAFGGSFCGTVLTLQNIRGILKVRFKNPIPKKEQHQA